MCSFKVSYKGQVHYSIYSTLFSPQHGRAQIQLKSTNSRHMEVSRR